LGLLKSTLLQLDPTFSERDYGTGTFREFIEKLSDAGFLTVKQVDRSLIVELKNGGEPQARGEPIPHESHAAVEPKTTPEPGVSREPVPAPVQSVGDVAALAEILRHARTRPHWPFYLRGLKQYLRSLDSGFDERKLGFTTLHDMVRQAQRENVFRVERNRQGILRIFPGDRFPMEKQEANLPEPASVVETPAVEEVGAPAAVTPLPSGGEEAGTAIAGPSAIEVIPEAPVEQPPSEEKPRRSRRTSTATAQKRRSASERRPRTRKKVAESGEVA
jgi:hypothetical protein